MKVPEDLQILWKQVQGDGLIKVSYQHLRELIERIAALTEQLETAKKDHELAQAKAEISCFESYQETADKALKAARAEIERLSIALGELGLQAKKNLDAADVERDTLRAQLEQMGRPVTRYEWDHIYPTARPAWEAMTDILAARARQQEQNKPQE